MGEKDGVTSGASGLVRWGIVGAGNIAHRFARSLANEPRSELTAISCRSATKATAFALEHGVATESALSDEALGGVAGSAHAALLARPDVDAVYVALPHHLHAEWVVAALRAGKAVLCEKPLCVSPEETALLARTANETQALLMEGMKTRFLPLYRRVRELVGQGAIGRLVRVEAVLQNAMLDRIVRGGDYLSSPSGGGMLLDTGVYCAAWIEDYLSGPFEVVCAEARWEAGVDCAVDAELSTNPTGPRTHAWSGLAKSPLSWTSPFPWTTSTARSSTSLTCCSTAAWSRPSCRSPPRSGARTCWGQSAPQSGATAGRASRLRAVEAYRRR